MHFLAIAIAAVAGSMVALQAPINSALGKHTSVLGATVVSFAIGLATAILFALSRGQLVGLSKAAEAPWWQLTGGILGAVFVGLAITLVPKIGAMQFAAAAVMGQIIMSLVVDHYGWLGVPAHAATWERVLAVPLIGVALWLSRR